MKTLTFLVALLFTANCYAQDLPYTRQALNKLTSKAFWGRGYTKNGMAKAAGYLESEFRALGLSPMDGKSFKQTFSFPVNTFPGKMNLKVNGIKLTPGKDFIVNQASRSLKAQGLLVRQDSLNFISAPQRFELTLQDKLTWSVARQVSDFTQVMVKKGSINGVPERFSANIENLFVPVFSAANICGIVKGTSQPDSIIVITAHYDHLGGMGKNTYFPGANDNASGVSFLLSLAKYYAANPQKYTMAFICFAAEEAGILGSKYFTENPLVPLNQIKFLFNFDLVGTGGDGATVVNATQYPKAFSQLIEINKEENLLVKINARGKAANSDHYFFTEKGVPAFFLYTQGGITAYHDVDDRAETLPFTVYANLFKLIVKFNNALMN